ncbi:sigma-70 family RNA polymerase sigma factor [Bacteroidales bacterium OttesenSCG-928-M11]|nr:sigma-70 family RNA polymerase sigma factor [Bacteroidales bacterium OttesenSCG-928-M11]
MIDKSSLNKLITASRQKDEKAFRLIVEEFQSLVYSISFRLLCNEDEAKDITQETFIRVWINLNKYNSKQKFSTWLYTIATNLCLDKLKRQKYFQKNDMSETILTTIAIKDDTEEKILNQELLDLISSFTQELTPKQKIVFTLRYLEELEIEEIKQITGMSSEKIKSNLFLAKKNIQNKIEKIYRNEYK